MKLEDDLMMKVIIVGDSGVGKTNLLERFVKDQFTKDMINTVGVDFIGKTVQIKDKIVKLQFWDTAGQEKYRSISAAYYKSADGVIIVYDTTSRKSFSNIDLWFKEIQKYSKENLSHLLIGNKIDLEELREVPVEEGVKFAEKKNIYFMEASAKTNVNDCVGEAFGVLLKEIFERKIQQGQIFLDQEERYASEFKMRSKLKKDWDSDNSQVDDEQLRKRNGCC